MKSSKPESTTMKNKALLAAMTAASLVFSSLSFAQPRNDDHRGPPHGRRGPPQMERHHEGPGAGPDHNFYRGERLPAQYRQRGYVVNDWRGHRLHAPQRGYQWVQSGSDYLLVGIATGVIAEVLLGR
jgi:Ni/Co efflux regulator RcnB